MENLSKVSEVEINFKPNFKPVERPQVKSSKDAYTILYNGWDKGLMGFVEEFKILLLNSAQRVLGVAEVTRGGRDHVLVDAGVIFTIALKAAATKIILAHNHPSGQLNPSMNDRNITDKLMMGSELLGIQVYDHLIITPDGYFSFRDRGFMEVE